MSSSFPKLTKKIIKSWTSSSNFPDPVKSLTQSQMKTLTLLVDKLDNWSTLWIKQSVLRKKSSSELKRKTKRLKTSIDEKQVYWKKWSKVSKSSWSNPTLLFPKPLRLVSLNSSNKSVDIVKRLMNLSLSPVPLFKTLLFILLKIMISKSGSHSLSLILMNLRLNFQLYKESEDDLKPRSNSWPSKTKSYRTIFSSSKSKLVRKSNHTSIVSQSRMNRQILSISSSTRTILNFSINWAMKKTKIIDWLLSLNLWGWSCWGMKMEVESSSIGVIHLSQSLTIWNSSLIFWMTRNKESKLIFIGLNSKKDSLKKNSGTSNSNTI